MVFPLFFFFLPPEPPPDMADVAFTDWCTTKRV